MILALRTDSDVAEIGLYKNGAKKTYLKWPAARQLSKDIHAKIKQVLNEENKDWQDLKGIVFYEGPGSFTALRIGAAVANTLASQLDIPIAQSSGEDWIKKGLDELRRGSTNRLVLPNYGAEPNITKPRK